MVLATKCQIFSMSFKKILLPIVIISLTFFSQCKKSGNTPAPPPDSVPIKDSAIVTGLNYPWEILWGQDNFIWMTERSGKISRVNPTTGAVSLLHTITSHHNRSSYKWRRWFTRNGNAPEFYCKSICICFLQL